MNLLNNLKLFAAAIITVVVVGAPLESLAAPAPINTGAKITFTFDDGLASSLTQAAPILAKYGFTGVSYVSTGCIGMTNVPNTCGADEDEVYMTWDQVSQLKNSYGWEIGAHTVSHPLLASSDPGFQPRKLTPAQVTQELTNSKSALAARGIDATNFATPYGDYNQAVLAQIAKLYASHRGFADTGYNNFPYNDYIIRDQQVQAGVSVATVKGYVDQAIANNSWLVLTFHDIQSNASTKPDDYEYKTTDLDQIAAYIKSKNVSVVNVKDGLATGTNLLPNSSFDNGLADGWTTDSATTVVKNTANNGNFPSPANSISMTATVKNTHLFSPMVAVESSSTYFLKSFLNLMKISSGSMGYYIDEYDANGSWISGQNKYNTAFAWPQTVGFEYKPSSANVNKARIQIILPANSKALAYIDNFQWFNKNVTTVTPPPANQINLVSNGTFDAGISHGWTTNDTANIVADSSNNGSPANPVNSVKMTATTLNRHLFSPKVGLIAGKTYNISTYVNVKQLASGEIGFYVDEYDINGNWISGKYITGTRTVGTTTATFDYTPSSVNVKSASLQIILVGNSGIVAYIDNVFWIQN